MATNAPTQSDETVLWEGNPSQWRNAGWFLACLLVLPIPVAFWKAIATKSYRITLTKQRLRIRWGVLSKQNEDVELFRVKDWSLKQPFNQRLFGKGTVHVLSSDRSAPNLYLKWISEPDQFIEKLRQAVEAVRDSKRVRELDMEVGDSGDIDDMQH